MQVHGFSRQGIKGRGAYTLDLKAMRGWMARMKGVAAKGSIVIRESGLSFLVRAVLKEDKKLIINYLSQILNLSNRLCRIIVISQSQNSFYGDFYFRGNGDTLVIPAEYLIKNLRLDDGKKLAAEILIPEMERFLAVCNNLFAQKKHELSLSLADHQKLDGDIITCRANIILLKDGHPNPDMLISETYTKMVEMQQVLAKYK